MSNHDYYLQPPEGCDDCDQSVCECDREADRDDAAYHAWKDDMLTEDWGD